MNRAKTARNEEIYRLREKERLTFREIGAQFGISYQAVQVIYFRLLQRYDPEKFRHLKGYS